MEFIIGESIVLVGGFITLIWKFSRKFTEVIRDIENVKSKANETEVMIQQIISCNDKEHKEIVNNYYMLNIVLARMETLLAGMEKRQEIMSIKIDKLMERNK